MATITGVRELCQRNDFGRNFFFRFFYTLGNVLDDVAIVIARAESHSGVMTTRILSQQLLGCTLRFDEILPVESRNRAQAGDAVRNSDLRESNAPVGSRRCFLSAGSILGDPLLEPDERREVRLIRS